MKKLTAFIPPVILGVIGLCIWAWGFMTFINALHGNGFPVAAPGSTTVTITNAGDYTLWNQTSGIVDGQFKTFPGNLDPGMTIKVVRLPEGTPMSMSTTMNSTVDINGTHLVSIGEFTFPNPGRYQITVTGLAQKRAFYLDQAKFFRTMSAFFVSGSVGLLFVIGSVVWGIFALIRVLSGKK